MKIYTRTGDRGETSLVEGTRVSKAHPRLSAYGTVDELNAFLGVALSTLRQTKETKAIESDKCFKMEQHLEKLQHRLFNLGSLLACSDENLLKTLPSLQEQWVTDLEEDVDQLTSQLPPLRQFILPGGGLLAAHLHVARTLCRRAEREVVALVEVNEKALPNEGLVIQFLNRLSDYLFVLSRFANHSEGYEDIFWQQES
jgi:cob(I)alamin adenosyltransferase